MMRIALTFALVLMGNADTWADEPSTWNQWRGPNRDGTISTPLPDSLKGLKEIWRVEDLGPSYSGPIVAEDRVFVTETIDKKSEVVKALDRKTGKVLWTASWEGSMTVPFFAARNGSWIRATPAYDGESLYVAGIRDVLVCLDAKTGKQRWRVDFMARFDAPLPAFGFVCSPLIDDEAVYVQAGASFVKLDKKTGKTIWQTLKDAGGMYGSAFSSPTFGKLEGKEQILVQTRTELTGVDPTSGEVLWKRTIPATRGMNILTPTLFEGRLFTSSYGGRSRLLNVSRNTDGFHVDEEWELKQEGYMCSPVVIDGHAYLHLKNRRFICIDLKAGEEKWVTDKSFGEYWSLVTDGKKILALDSRGELVLIQADPKEYRELDTRKLDRTETWAHLAVAGNEIYIRDLTGITAYRFSE